MAEVIIYSGSFNPIHNGHTAVAQYVAASGLCDELWIMVSPQNPHKVDADIAPQRDRLEMARIAVAEKIGARNIKVSDFEMTLPKPSYTVNTLKSLGTQYPGIRFSLLIGTDIIPGLHRWHEAQYLLDNYKIYVYPRTGNDFEKLSPGMTFLAGAPTIEVSSTEIRAGLAQGRDLSGMLSRGVVNYIYDHDLWIPDAARRRLESLDREIGEGPASAAGYLERGRLNYKFAEYGRALNDFLKAEELEPGNKEAAEYIKLLQDIFEFRYTDIYNP